MTHPIALTRRHLLLGAATLVAAGALRISPALAGQRTPVGAHTFLVAGLDTRTKDEPENTDVLMVSRVDLDAGTVRTMSIPRDLLVEIPGIGFGKVNSAYDFGAKAAGGDWVAGIDLVTRTIEQNFGLTIDGAITTNLQGLPAVVDAFGGVTVENPYDVYDAEYPTADYGTKEIFYPAGRIMLDGEQALEFCRTRHQDGDDGRVMRQQLVLTALLERAQDPAVLPRLPEIVAAGRDAVETTVADDVQQALIAAVPGIPIQGVVWGTMTQYLWEGTTDAGMWVYQGDWNTLPGYVQTWLAG